MQNCIVAKDQVKFEKEVLIKYESAPGIFRNACPKCGSFVIKDPGDGKYILSTAALNYADDATKEKFAPTMHIFMENAYEKVTDGRPEHQQWP